MRTGRSHEHPHLRLLLLVLLALLGVRAIEGQSAPPVSMTSSEVHRAADTSTQLRVVVSLSARKLHVLGPTGDTLYSAPVAVGSGRRLSANGRTWRFATPVGVRVVQSTEADPVWIRPDWAYIELARQRGLRLDSVSVQRPRVLSNGDSLVVRGSDIGRLKGGVFTVLPSGNDIVIRGVLYMPPLGSPYRMMPGTLGKYRLNLGNSVGLHGTLEKASIGKAVTHGCMRLGDAAIEWLYLNVPVGTPVFIY
jgi:hypothetical protein